MKHTSVKLNQPIELINITSINPLISKCQIKVCYVSDEPNRNGTIITKEVAAGLAQTLPGSPIVGFFNEETQDFEGHEKAILVDDNGNLYFEEITRPYGFVDLNAKVWFEKYLDDGFVEREYLVTEGYLWTGQYPECQRVIDSGNNQSMELDKEKTKSTRAKMDNGKPEFFIINEAVMSKLCILGEEVEPCFEGSNITEPTIQFSFKESFENKLLDMMNELKDFLLKGGNEMTETNNTPVLDNEQSVVDTPVVDETSAVVQDDPGVADEFATKKPEGEEDKKDDVELCPKCGKPLDQCVCDDDDKDKKYNLDEIPEYVKLSEEYSSLKDSHDSLTATYNSLLEEVNGLKEFKLAVEKKEKEAMISKFYMLSDADKADVVENIDKYSLDEIESKLSVLCVRNKVSFAEDKTDSGEAETSYNLTETQQDNLMPAWVKAVKAVKESENL